MKHASTFLPYGRQEISDADVEAVVDALRSELITTGPTIARFEDALAEYLGAKHVVAFANGTAALHGAAFAAGLVPGDEALTSPLSFAASSNCVLYQGARPRFVDISPATWNLDVVEAVAHINERTRAVIATSFAGLPVNLEPLQPIRHRAVVIEDASHALGGRRNGIRVGGAGGADLTTFSFHPVKAITTGEGGAVATEDDGLARRLRVFRTHGITREGVSPSETEGDWYYDMPLLGFNYRITDFQCALGLSQLRRLEESIEARNGIAERYRDLLADETRIALPPAAQAGDVHAYHLFAVRVLGGAAARLATFESLRRVGIGVQVHYIPIYRLSHYRDVLAYPQDTCAAAEEYYAGAISLPMFPAMTNADIDRVVSELEEALPVKVETRNLAESVKLLERARRIIPAVTQTLSKNPSQWVQGVAPAYISRASGAHVWDVDGNRYIDFPMALGPVILGHAHPAVNDAITRQLKDGITFTLPHPIEVEVAERVVDLVPGAERVRFAKTGSDATSAAVRLARACTGRDVVLVCGYHGWHDWYIGSTSRAAGVPDAVRALIGTFEFNNLASLDAALGDRAGETAAVILEPCGAEEPAPGFLEGVVARAHAAGAIAVFDEIITGFRLAPGGAQEHYGVQADLAAYGKALGNGMPISALVGKAELMDRLEDVFFSGTHAGEALSLAAARAVLDQLDDAAYEALNTKGERLRAGIERAIDEAGVADSVKVGGAAPRTVVSIREPEGALGLPAKTLVQQELAKRGVLFNGSNFICLAHSNDDLDIAIDAYRAAFARLADGLSGDLTSLLEGEPIQPAFRPVA